MQSHQHTLSMQSTHSSHAPPFSSSTASSPNKTRILLLSNFPASLKTRDIQQVFAEWENERGGLKIKWKDDTSCLVVFNDPLTAKKAYLALMNDTPSVLNDVSNPTSPTATIQPYNGADVAQILQTVQNRPRSRSNAGSMSGIRHHRKGSSMAGMPPMPTSATRSNGGTPSGHSRNMSRSSLASTEDNNRPHTPSDSATETAVHSGSSTCSSPPTTVKPVNAWNSGPPSLESPQKQRVRIDAVPTQHLSPGSLGLAHKANDEVGIPSA